MKIGSLYTVKKYFWLLFPTRETVPTAALAVSLDASPTSGRIIAPTAALAADFWSKHFNCEITYFSPDSIIIFLEEDGIYKKVLTADGRIGWTCFDGSYNECFEEMKA